MQVLRCLKEQRQQIKSRLYGQRALHSTVNRAGRRSPWIQQMSWEISAFRPSNSSATRSVTFSVVHFHRPQCAVKWNIASCRRTANIAEAWQWASERLGACNMRGRGQRWPPAGLSDDRAVTFRSRYASCGHSKVIVWPQSRSCWRAACSEMPVIPADWRCRRLDVDILCIVVCAGDLIDAGHGVFCRHRRHVWSH